MTLTLKPTPDAQVIPFPQPVGDDREAVVGQFTNLLTVLVQRHGAYLGRMKYLEASIAAVVRRSFEEGTLQDTHDALEWAYNEELDRLEPIAPGFAG
jgi:hypothetical protein